MKKLALLVPVLILFALLFGCPGTDNGGTGDDQNGTIVAATAICPASLQACGAGCIPTNAICCDYGVENAYCLQPSTGCGNGSCNSCPEGQVFCGMFCKPIGEECCVGDSCNAAAKKNPYVGVWEFKGLYRYHTKENCKETDVADLVSGDLTVRATFIEPTFDLSLGPLNFWDYHTVWVSNIIVDDSAFGTGTAGVAPVLHDTRNDLSGSQMNLPLLPRDPTDPENYGLIDKSAVNPDGRRYDPLSEHQFTFWLPTGPKKWGTWILFGAGLPGEPAFTMNASGTEFTSVDYVSPDPFKTNDTWDARSQIGTSPLSLHTNTGVDATVFCGPRFIKWTARKIS